MKVFVQKHHRLLFYSLWFVINLIQAAFSDLQDDEAYYWVFSRFLDWGYFDHPPMTAVFIKSGYALFSSTLGVRLLIVAANTATIYCCELLLRRKDVFLFYAVCFSLAVLQLSGFMAVPDIPLLFFTALFFLVYQKFVHNSGWVNTLLLALVAACLLYSKYHAVLVILFTLLSNPSLFKKGQLYGAGLLALLLFLPHLWWQYEHDWISFRYHLFESNVNPYKFNYTTDYLLGQLLIAGPLAGFILWPTTFLYKPQDKTERALKFTGIGVFLFFFLSTFKGKVEANWTAPAIVPIIVLGHQYLLQHAQQRKWLQRLVIPTLVLVAFIRVIIVVDVVPLKVVRERFHYWKGWPQQLAQQTNRLPAALSSSYQRASQYWFHTGVPTYSVNEYIRRRNNYNFWPLEDSLLGKPVVVFDSDLPPADSLQTPMGMLRYAVDSSFHAFSKIMFRPETHQFSVGENQPLVFTAHIDMPAQYRRYLQQNPQVDAPVKVGVFDGQKWIADVPLPVTLRGLVQQEKLQVHIPLSVPKGSYFLRFAIGSDMGWFTHNSSKINVAVQ